jgi:hypothetical protein
MIYAPQSRGQKTVTWVHLGIRLTLKCWFGIDAFPGTVVSFLGAKTLPGTILAFLGPSDPFLGARQVSLGALLLLGPPWPFPGHL